MIIERERKNENSIGLFLYQEDEHRAAERRD